MKLNLGCGGLAVPGFIGVDLYDDRAEVKMDIKALTYEDNSVDEIFSSHVIEHFDFWEAIKVLKEWHRVLKPGGILDIETPDMLGSCKRFINSDEVGRLNLYGHFFSTPWLPGQCHKFLYTELQLCWSLQFSGFVNMKRVVASRNVGQEDLNLKMICQKPKEQ